ncbi:MAG TPA: phosphate signaling complex protein PhoU [Burkholderiales bacterium]|nr:phosphate signaling complex protein PhoU [Burkholderiales bacterium]
MQSDHTSKQFDNEMEAIRGAVLTMGGMVERQIERAIDAFGNGDADPLAPILDDERIVNNMQIEIDRQCGNVIVRRQPAAIDLRIVITVIQIANDLERVGDEAKKIALRARPLAGIEKRPAPMCGNEIGRLSEMARAMLRDALDAYARLDVTAAAEVIARDEQVDVEFAAITRRLMDSMMEDPRTISATLDAVFIAKSIERIGDHATNIAEYVIHIVKGKDMRHAPLEEIRRETKN